MKGARGSDERKNEAHNASLPGGGTLKDGFGRVQTTYQTKLLDYEV